MSITQEALSEPPEDSLRDLVATAEETAAVISSLQKVDWAKLQLIARSFFKIRSLSHTWAEPEDLLQEAIIKTLGGERKWRKSRVSIIRHLERTMESISGHIAEHRATSSEKLSLIRPSSGPPSPEKVLQDKTSLQNIRETLGEDAEAFEVLFLRAEGRSSAEIRTLLCIGPKEYDAIRKRIDRAFIRFAKIGDQYGS